MSDSIHILLLEDSIDDAQLVILNLEHQGIQVEYQRVETKDDFVAALDDNPDLVISDLLMDSDLFYQAVRAQEMWREIPFIILTSQNRAHSFADRRSKRQDRAIRLSKPFPVDDLLSFAARFTNDAGNSSAASFTETA